MKVDEDKRPTDVYRLYDEQGRLLYIGISGNLPQRLMLHSRDKEWWPRVSRAEAEEHPTRRAAFDAEYAAILSEAPLFNTPPKKRAVLPPIIRRDEPLRAVDSEAS